MAVYDQLPGGRDGASEAEAVDQVVEPPFEELQQVLTGDARCLEGPPDIPAKLPFGNPLRKPELLLLEEPRLVIAHLAAIKTMHARRGLSPQEGAAMGATYGEAELPAFSASCIEITGNHLPSSATCSK